MVALGNIIADADEIFRSVRVTCARAVRVLKNNIVAVALIPVSLVRFFDNQTVGRGINRLAALVGDIDGIRFVKDTPVPTACRKNEITYEIGKVRGDGKDVRTDRFGVRQNQYFTRCVENFLKSEVVIFYCLRVYLITAGDALKRIAFFGGIKNARNRKDGDFVARIYDETEVGIRPFQGLSGNSETGRNFRQTVAFLHPVFLKTVPDGNKVTQGVGITQNKRAVENKITFSFLFVCRTD